MFAERAFEKGLGVRNSVVRNLKELCGDMRRRKRGKQRPEHGRS